MRNRKLERASKSKHNTTPDPAPRGRVFFASQPGGGGPPRNAIPAPMIFPAQPKFVGATLHVRPTRRRTLVSATILEACDRLGAHPSDFSREHPP